MLQAWSLNFVCGALAMLSIVCGQVTYAQVVSGTIVGAIADMSGGIVPKAKITITNVETGVSRASSTDVSGNYSVPDLPPGTYSVSVESPGFTTSVHTQIRLFAASTARVDMVLQPGSVNQTVTVSGEAAPMLQTESAEVGRAFTTNAVQQLPLSTGHNFQNLLTLVPGTEYATRQHSFFYNPENSLSSPSNGLPARSNTYNIEGINDNERSALQTPYIVPMEAIQEVAITSSNYLPSQGTALGSVVDVIIKSGTNKFHGEGYEFYTGNGLQARNFFAQGANGQSYQAPHSVDNYWGGNLGGPIRKEKTFFFVNYLSHPQRTGNFYTFSVPTAAIRNGDFSDPALPKIYDPGTGDTADCLQGGNAGLCGTGRSPFPGNVIPASRLDPVAQTLLSHVLPPNANQIAPGLQKYQNNLLYSSQLSQDVWDLTAKVDHYVGQHEHFSGRFSYTNPQVSQPGIFGVYGGPLSVGGTNGYEGTGFKKAYNAGINWVHIFSPSLLSETRIGLNRHRNDAVGVGYGQNLAEQAGIPGVNISAFASGSSVITGEGFSDPLIGVANSFPWYHGQTYIIVDNKWSKIYNKHTFAFGFEYYRIRDDYLLGQWPMGQFGFGPGPTSLNGGTAGNFANSFAGLLLGTPISAFRGYANVFPTYRQNQIFPYIGDTWQATSRLTVNLGLRWEYYGPPTPAFAGGFSNYNPSNNTLELAGVGNIPRNSGLQPDYKNFGPRVGVAYRLGSGGVLRAGFGITTMAFPIDTWDYNYPIEPTQSFTSISSFGPGLLNATTPVTFQRGFPALPPFELPSNGVIAANTPALINQSYFYLPLNWKNPYLMSWNVAYERQLPGNWVLDVAYVGNRGVRTPVTYNLNAATVYGNGALGQPEYNAFGRTASTTMYFAMMRSAYDSLQVKLDHHFSKGFAMTTSYTFGKAIGYESESGDYPNGLLDYVVQRRNWAATDFDQRQMLSQSIIWSLPLGKGHAWFNSGIADRLFGGWQVAGVWAFHTGFPLNFSCTCPAFNTPGTRAYPNITGPVRKLYGIQTSPWFDTNSFSVPAAGTQGNVGPFVSSGPLLFNLDASVLRTIKLTEQWNMELRMEALHSTNTPQFANPNTTLGNPNFGLVTSATGSRIINLGAKIRF